MKATWYIFSWHHWCGLIVGLFLLMMSITGSILVFSDELEAFEEHHYPTITTTTGQATFDASFETVRSKYPDWEIRLYHLPQQDKALVYELRKKENSKKIFAHPVSGQIIGSIENANKSIQRQLLLFHYTIFSGTIGKATVFITGCLFLITLITGVIVYRKSIIKALTFNVHFNRKTTRSFYSSLHRIVGVWSLIFNLLIVTTGLWLSGQITLTALKSTTPSSAINPASNKITSIDSVVTLLSQKHGNYNIHLIRIRPGGNTIQVSGRFTTDPAYYGNYYSTFSFNGETLQIEKSQFMKDMKTGAKLQKMAGPLHFGNYGGLLLKFIYCLFGITPAFLSISGFIIWRKRSSNRTQARILKKRQSLSLS